MPSTHHPGPIPLRRARFATGPMGGRQDGWGGGARRGCHRPAARQRQGGAYHRPLLQGSARRCHGQAAAQPSPKSILPAGAPLDTPPGRLRECRGQEVARRGRLEPGHRVAREDAAILQARPADRRPPRRSRSPSGTQNTLRLVAGSRCGHAPPSSTTDRGSAKRRVVTPARRNRVRAATPASESRYLSERKTTSVMPDWMIALAHSLQGKSVV